MTKNMTRKALTIVATAILTLGMMSALGCSSPETQSGNSSASEAQTSNQISVYSREDGSGTRGAFVELFGLEEKDASGNKIDMTTDAAAITNSTSVMMTSVASDPDAIGYISLGSLNDTVKAVKIDGIEATAQNVKSGDYKVSRPFNIVFAENLSAPAQDFVDFIMSSDGQAIIEDNGYIGVDENAAPFTATGASGKVVIAGSSSVTPIMEKLAEAYKAVNPDVAIEVQQSDSTTGVNMAIEGTCDIGMASRDLKDSEASSGVSATSIAKDGIAVIVAPASIVDSLTSDQVKAIFSGEALTWAEVIG
ncbi:substrate-binding domain-containing protein [Enterorhabdus sp. P55]|uniref:substrate-binding domain-containing protein n=1 Tax=Enterorhabdus sp. P55 TaxID=2304571 RepID=UPI001F2DE32D|nr:substrate-binding domain-containing protein [Enterorhabdus sp. P55]